MKRYIKSDVNSYTQYRDTSDEIIIAEYESNRGYVVLYYDSFHLFISSDIYGNSDDELFSGEYGYDISEINIAIDTYNSYVEDLGGTDFITTNDVDKVLSEYGKSLADFKPGGFYDKLRKDASIRSNSRISCATFARNNMASRIKRNPTDEEVAIVDNAKDYLDSCKAAFESAQNAYQFARRTSKCSDGECSDLYDKLMKAHGDYIDAERKYMDLWDEYMGYSYY